MYRFRFYIRQTFEAKLELVEVIANDSWNAINRLPDCVSWDFARFDNGEYWEVVQ